MTRTSSALLLLFLLVLPAPVVVTNIPKFDISHDRRTRQKDSTAQEMAEQRQGKLLRDAAESGEVGKLRELLKISGKVACVLNSADSVRVIWGALRKLRWFSPIPCLQSSCVQLSPSLPPPGLYSM